MSITRREFLGRAASAAALALPMRLRRGVPNVALLDLGDGCSLRESIRGYEFACHPSSPSLLGVTRVLIIPAALAIPPSTAQLILRTVECGATVILESGAGFAEYPDFCAHRDSLREYFQVDIGPPTALWPASDIPYIEYSWPSPAIVRDFSNLVSIAPQPGNIIARAAGRPAALERSVGLGRLVFLGSPLGPALWAGDAEARSWIIHLLSSI